MTEPIVEFQQVDLNDLTYFWLPNGAPCFLANREDICDQVEGIGFQIYYLIANEEIVTKSNNNKNATAIIAQQINHSGKLIKVVKNIVGRAIATSDEDFGKDLITCKEEATYSLPSIPYAMVKKLDEFFRLVYAQHGTESIVMLTFDSTKEGSDGWGILVPEQTNTAAHCKYDPDSVASLKEDHVLIVGSVHSHPEMSAYASGTDHSDQADFDGLHITYGWQKSVGNGATQYHAELQMGGSNYIMNIDDIFESFNIDKEPDPDVVEWTTKVKKPSAPALGAPKTASYGVTNIYTSGTTQPTPGIINNNVYDSSRFVAKRTQMIPDEILAAVPYNAVIIAEINTTELGRMICPSCGISLFKNEIYLGSSCPACDIPIVASSSHVQAIIHSVNGYQGKRYKNWNVPYYLWAKGYNNGKEHTILLIKEENKQSSYVSGDNGLKVATFDDDEDDFNIKYELREEFEKSAVIEYTDLPFAMEFWASHTWCCEKDIMNGHLTDCDCKTMVTDEDAMDFDEFCFKENLEVYKKDSDCDSCVFWYTGGCGGYRQAVIDYKNSCESPKDVIIDHIEQNLNLDGCVNWESYEANGAYTGVEKETEILHDNTH